MGQMTRNNLAFGAVTLAVVMGTDGRGLALGPE